VKTRQGLRKRRLKLVRTSRALLARVKELEEDIALVGGQRDALNV
jgi:hypothetical protein